MSTKRSGVQTSPSLAFAPQVGPIGDAELALVQRAMAGIGPEWSVELHGICAAEATLVLLPDGGDDENGPSFVISRDACGFRLDQVHWDTLTEVGVFASLSDVVAALRPRLVLWCNDPPPASVTIH